ncbi:hypothetical protein Pla123a_36810 [Posidoniimonas polymericola]|uniref:Putative restriction endonuclease domain-containing protein n=1 Tax=Posidoniimonas polymericola TaxID=2528002 RepID=A0A5C5YDH2_9BACT|nr:Uma2 family endonuclease [Posidoniimonas polymericola]TWT73787.1 hypothetical protein Pla123a_36810 [Posidoniimonas polymericola]
MSTSHSPDTGSSAELFVASPTPNAAPSTDGAVVLRSVSWRQYESLLEVFDNQSLRHTYDSGRLELMSPTLTHDWEKHLLARLLDRMAEELGVETKGIGSTTLRLASQEIGVEPDECFYIANEPAMRARGGRGDKLDLANDPPPDLAIEIDVTSSSLPRLPVFAAIGVPEVWRLEESGLQFLRLVEGGYQACGHSVAFPFLPVGVLQELVQNKHGHSELQLVKQFTAWVREHAGD